MRFPEQRLWDRVRNNLKKFGIHLERIENIAGEGIPDVMALCNGVMTMIELKAIAELPKRRTTRVLGDKGLSIAQKNWHLEWHRYGGRSLILIGIGSKQVFAIDGRFADSVNDWSIDELEKENIFYEWLILAEFLGIENHENKLC